MSKLPNPSGGFPQASGITYNVNTSFKRTALTDANGIFLNVTGKRRISNVMINGEELNKTKLYSTALNNCLATGGDGDGYSMLYEFKMVNESLLTDIDAISNYIINILGGEIPEKYKELTGRININKVPATDPTPFNNIYNLKKGNKISTGAIVGIIIGALVLAFLILIGILFAIKPPQAKVVKIESSCLLILNILNIEKIFFAID